MRKQWMERNAPAEWNVRVLTEDDFWLLSAAAGIVVHEVPIERLGVHFKRRHQHLIFINDRLRGVERRFVLWHELAHCYLHPPGIQFFHGFDSLVETEADVFAVCALIPRPALLHYWPSELADLYGYPPDLIEFRQSVWDRWRL